MTARENIFRCISMVGLLALPLSEARADLTFGSIERPPSASPIAIAGLLGANAQESRIGADIAEVVSADLMRSGIFKPIDPSFFPKTVDALADEPRLDDWKKTGAQALVDGRIERSIDGHLQIQFRLWDVFGKRLMAGRTFDTTVMNWRSAAHLVADAAYKRFTGNSGNFASQIAYIAETGPMDKRLMRLAAIDQDGANFRYLTGAEERITPPQLSPRGRGIIYLSRSPSGWQLDLIHLDTSEREIIGDFPNLVTTPSFSPDEQKLLLTEANGSDTNIYEMDLRNRRTVKLTNAFSHDASPSYSPDGTEIAFESDRGGTHQIYVMNVNGSNPHRISFGNGTYTMPKWSPKDDLIAFVKVASTPAGTVPAHPSVGVMKSTGQYERTWAEDVLGTAVSWSPNGQALVFSRPGDEPRLWTSDQRGYIRHMIETPTAATYPVWSAVQ